MIIEIDSREYMRRLFKRFKDEIGYDRLSDTDKRQLGDRFIDGWRKSETTDPEEFADDIMNCAVDGAIAGSDVGISIARLMVADLVAEKRFKK